MAQPFPEKRNLKSLFSWQPLRPPAAPEDGIWLRQLAVCGGLLALLCGGLQVWVGWTEGAALYLPLIASGLLFGLPHGAIDHLVALGLAKQPLKTLPLLVVIGLYLSLVAVFALLWWVQPVVALAAFLCITIYHWGVSDTAFDITCRQIDAFRHDAWLRFAHGGLRGLIPVGLPFIAFPEQVERFLQSSTSLFAAKSPSLGALPLIIGFCLILLFGLEWTRLRKQADARQRVTLTAESLLLITFFAVVPPLAAIGWYFCLWHGLRHMLRLSRYSGSAPGHTQPSRRLPRLGLFFWRALPFTLVSLVLLAASALCLAVAADLNQWIALYLVLISTLTFPHIVIVEWMDRSELKLSSD